MDDYLAGLDPATRAVLEHVRDIGLGVVPEAEQGTSYGIPVLMVDGRAVLGLRAGKKNLSLYPFSGSVVTSLADRLDGFSVSTGTIRFTVGRPLPDDLVRDVVARRVDEIRG